VKRFTVPFKNVGKGGAMSRLIWFLPACAALVLAAVLVALGQQNPPIRLAGLALLAVSIALVRWAQKRAPLSKRGIGPGGAVAVLGIIFLATLAIVVVAPMLKG